MGQVEILKILKKDEWIKGVEIVKKLKQDNGLVNRSLRKLFEQGEVERKTYGGKMVARGYIWRKIDG